MAKITVACCVCGKPQFYDEVPPADGKCLCRDCYEDVKKRFEELNTGQSLRLEKPTKKEHLQ